MELFDLGPRAHLAKRYDYVQEPGYMKVLLKQEISCPAEQADCHLRCVEQKLSAARDLIESLPPVVHDWLLGRKASEPLDDARGASKPLGARRGAVVLETTEALGDTRQNEEAYFVEANRLQGSLSSWVVRDICHHLYDQLLVENPPWNLRVGSIEAALLYWELCSQIHGCCRVPVTLVTRREGRQYSFIFIALILGEHTALLGRYLLKELCLPLQRRKLSAAVQKASEMLRKRGHELCTLYLGLPTGSSLPGDEPIYWRLLKLSVRRQIWQSVLASVDFYMALRRDVLGLICESQLGADVQVPTGLALLRNRKGEVRLKVTEPLLVRQRLKRSPRKARSPGMAAIDKKSLSALSMKMGRMEQKHRSEQELWHQLCFNKPPELEGHTVEWPSGQESECSSVSSASLDEYAEDFCVDRHQVQSTFLPIQTIH